MSISYKIINRVVVDDYLIGYILELKTNHKLRMFMSVEDIVYSIEEGQLYIDNVKVLTNGKLKGINGYHLSKVPKAKFKDIGTINMELSSILRKLYSFMYPKGSVEVRYMNSRIDIYAGYTMVIKDTKYIKYTELAAVDALITDLSDAEDKLSKRDRQKYDDITSQYTEGNVIISVRKSVLEI